MRQVSLAVAKDKFSEYAAAAAGGEEIVITRHGQPYARLVAIDEIFERRRAAAATVARLREMRARRDARGEAGLTLDEVVELVRDQRR